MSEKKKKKPMRSKARLPRGFVDRSPADIRATDRILSAIRQVFENYGFDPIETPMFEYTDALGKFLPDQDRPNEGVFSLTDEDEQWMSLRYDLTAPLARHVAEHIHDIQLPYRTYRNGWVFRNEKPGPGRFRQFMQFDADSVGAPPVTADAEMCMMMADTMEALGIARGDYVVRVNNRKVLDGVMAAIGIGGDEHAGTRLAVLRAIDKLDRLGIDGVRELLGAGRKDKSGDFTKGAGLDEGQIDTVIAIISMNVSAQPGPYLLKLELGDFTLNIIDSPDEISLEIPNAEPRFARVLQNPSVRKALRDLAVLRVLVVSSDYDSDRIRIDLSCVRGLEYYTGPVYECELTFPVTNEKGEEVVFGSVAGGGRYDGLVKRFTGQDVPATGFSIGVSRLVTALKNLGKLDDENVVAPVIVCVMDTYAGALARYQNFTQQLRNAGIRAEMFQGNPKQFGKQLQYADRRGAAIAIIQGSNERENGVVQIKDMIEGRRQAKSIASNEEWREARPGQFEIAEADLVAEVQKLLAAQAEG